MTKLQWHCCHLFYRNIVGSLRPQVRVCDCPSQWEGESQKTRSIDGDSNILSRQQVCPWIFSLCDVNYLKKLLN